MQNELTRWNPMRNMMNLQDEVHDLFRDFFRDADRTGWTGVFTPPADIEETPDAYVVTADLPGMTQKEISITLADHVLTVHGERKSEKKDGKGTRQRVERFSGMFSRSFILPSSVNPDGVKAAYKDGVLTVTLPKWEEAKPRQITVKVD